jgi:hypothetical protein
MLSRAVIQPEAPFLTEDETEYAVAALSKPVFSQVVRANNDPKIAGQEIGLWSFTPSRNAQPDQYGNYGVAKFRGAYPTPKLAAAAAEQIVREVDSVNEILHIRVGEVFPVTKETKWIEKFDAVDLRKHVEDIQREKEKFAEEESERERKTVLDREKKLLDENKEILAGTHKEDPLDVYIRLNVARAQLKWTKADTERKLEEEIKPAIERRNKEIAEMDIEHPDFKAQFMKKYFDARSDACLSNDIPEDHEKVQQGFLKYLVEDK